MLSQTTQQTRGILARFCIVADCLSGCWEQRRPLILAEDVNAPIFAEKLGQQMGGRTVSRNFTKDKRARSAGQRANGIDELCERRGCRAFVEQRHAERCLLMHIDTREAEENFRRNDRHQS
jgi:hypothetical protein